ncbi:unnamed protein product [Closterium sp. Naga37s-1]|nr:unnamed protein product [Closterium sp. Naga37s-1]
MAPPARAAVPDATAARHLTVDGDVGLSDDAARSLARGFFLGGFLLLPWLWFVNCYFFWPVLRYNAGHDPQLRSYMPGLTVGSSVADSPFPHSLPAPSSSELLPCAPTWWDQPLAAVSLSPSLPRLPEPLSPISAPLPPPFVLADVMGSAIGCSVAFSLLACWSLAYSLGGEALLGADTWQKLAVYNIVDGIL